MAESAPAKKADNKAIVVSKPVQSMQGAEIVEYCRSKPDEAARTITALLTMNTGEMPGTLFVRRDKDGYLKRVRIGVPLKESKKHLVKMWTGKAETYEITAAGFRELNSVAGLHIITPSEVVVNNQRQPNPYVEVDPQTGTPLVVFCRKVVVGPAQVTGSMTATDVMLRFDLGTYLLESILAKLKGLKEAGAKFAIYGGPDDKPTVETVPPSRWKYMAVLGRGFEVGVWINVAHPEFAAVMSNHVTKMKFAERVAQTIAERNALKSHPGMTSAVVAQNGVGVVPMIAWHQATTRAEIDELRRLIDENTLADRADVDVVQVEAEAGGSEADRADADDAAEDAERTASAVEGRDSKNEEEREEEPEAGTLKPEDRAAKVAAAMEVAATLAEALGAKKIKAALKELGIEGDVSEATPEQLDKLIALKPK